MVIKCLLCLEYPTIPGPKFLELFSDEGLRLDICSIINKHFWLKTYRNGGESQRICMTCWEVVRDFHILYQRVEEVHRYLEMKTIEIDDPLPNQDVVMLKSEDTPVPMLQDPIMGHTCLTDNPFDSEVKVEVNDLDLLPQIEIIETAPDIATVTTTKVPRRARNASPKTTTKRIKKEPAHLLDDDDDDDDDDLEFDVFANKNLSEKDIAEADELNKSFLSSALDVQDAECNFNKDTRTRRGRPRKSEAEKAKPTTTVTPRKRGPKPKASKETAAIKNERVETEEPSCSTAAQKPLDVPHIKTEKTHDEPLLNITVASEAAADADVDGDGNADAAAASTAAQIEDAGENFDISNAPAEDDDDDDHDNDNDFAIKDSDDSSNSESGSGENDSEASDWAPDEPKSDKFAVILKKMRNTPKKYKKREKPLVEPKRMSKDEIAARNAQQAEYDNIITKFFEKIRCPKCELLVHTFGDMRAHFRVDHNDDHGFVECCGRRFATRKSLAEHIMIHYNPEHFKCKTCEKVCRDSTQLELHEQSHLPNPPQSKSKKTFQCEKCSKTFSSKASFEHHMVAKHVPREEFKFECPECKKKWPSKAKLRKHMQTHDITRQKICDQCGKTFRCNTSMKKHVDAEHSEVKPEPQQCTICNTWYRNLSGLRTHQKFMHENLGNEEHRCHICNKVSTNHRALRRHIYLNHECEKKFKCHMCDKAFKREQDLREHISVHTGEALYTCPNCPMTFSSSANMYKHRQRLHKAEYAAHKQQPMALNIIKQAKSGPNTVRTKRRMVGADAEEVAPPTHAHPIIPHPPTPAFAASNVLINPHILVASQFGTHNLSKLSE